MNTSSLAALELFARRRRELDQRFQLLLRFFTPGTIFMEIGARDCQLALRAASYVERVWAVEPQQRIARVVRPPTNLRVVRSDALAAIPAGSVDVAFSDGLKDLDGIHRLLADRGVYLVCGQLLPAQLFREARFSGVAHYAGNLRVPAALAHVSRAITIAAYK